MALKDVLRPKAKEELGQSIFDFYSRTKDENKKAWCVAHILEENTMGDGFVKEVKDLIKNKMDDTATEEVLILPPGNGIYKPFVTFLAESKFEVINGSLDWNYHVYENGLIWAKSKDRAEAIMITTDYIEKLNEKGE